MEEFEITGSAMGKIVRLDNSTTITDKQFDTMKDLGGRVKALTKPQEKMLDDYLAKFLAEPQLSEGAKTYVKTKFYQQKFDFQKSFTNKYTQKGNEKENESIKDVVNYLGLPMVFKNETRYYNDYSSGVMDTVFKALNFQMDMKNVYYPDGLDVFDGKLDHDYEWQQHNYNWLLGVDNGLVVKRCSTLRRCQLKIV